MEDAIKRSENARLEISKRWIILDNFCLGDKKAHDAPYYWECQKCGSLKIDLHGGAENTYFYCKDCGEIMK
jgi:hypothetical protein